MGDKFFDFFFYGIFIVVILGFILCLVAMFFVFTHPHEIVTGAGQLANEFWSAAKGVPDKVSK